MERAMIEGIDEGLRALMDDRCRLNEKYLNQLSSIQVKYRHLEVERGKYVKILEENKKGD